MVQDDELFVWLTTLYPIWAQLDDDAIYTSAKVAMAELLQSGCTTSPVAAGAGSFSPLKRALLGVSPPHHLLEMPSHGDIGEVWRFAGGTACRNAGDQMVEKRPSKKKGTE